MTAMRAAGTHLAAVTGNKGTVIGFVTMEDLLEEPGGRGRPRRRRLIHSGRWPAPSPTVSAIGFLVPHTTISGERAGSSRSGA
ncbi:hypothetical protein [Streptomyces sp. NPDC097981]|uniref:hypothetical protein n=1 Tax=Streptomyces sp. NPDC097981 TaxID=3155428 RepID=UPI00331E1FDA